MGMSMDFECMKSTTRPITTETVESGLSSSAPDRSSHFEPMLETPSLFGESLLTTAFSGTPSTNVGTSRTASIVPCSVTKAKGKVVSLCDRLTPLLISRGLVNGTIPTSIRKGYGQPTLDIVSSRPDGESAESQNQDY